MKFPMPKLADAYEKAKGHVFTKSVSNQYFKDEVGSTEYDFHCMEWLQNKGHLLRIKPDIANFQFSPKFKIKE